VAQGRSIFAKVGEALSWLDETITGAWRSAREQHAGPPPPMSRRDTIGLVLIGLFGISALVIVVFVIVIPLLSWLIGLGTGAAGKGVDWLAAWNMSKVVTVPVRAYLDAHTEGLPVDADFLWSAWLIAGSAIVVLGFFGSTGARIGWALFGAMTVAMVWQQTAQPGRPVAAGIAVLWWIAFAVLVYRVRVLPVGITNHWPLLYRRVVEVEDIDADRNKRNDSDEE
jgi:hypothetical protein